MPGVPAAVFSASRLAAVQTSGLLDTDPEEAFDRLTALAAELLDAPCAFVTVVDERRSFSKSCVGVAAGGPGDRQNPVEQSFCQYVVGSGEPLLVGDARTDPRTAGNPAIELMGVAAWLGYPVHAPDGEILGTFCVVDTRTRDWTPREEQILDTLAHAASSEVAVRIALEQARSDAARELARFAAIAEQTSDFVAMAGVDGCTSYVNPAGRRLVGLAPTDDVSRMPLTDFVTESARSRLTGEAQPAAVEHGVWTGEMELADRAGRAIPMSLTIAAHRDDQGELVFFSTTARDLRERYQAERAVHAERERYRSLVTQAPVGIFLADSDGDNVYVNDRLAELVGQQPEKIAGRGWVEHLHAEDRARAGASWAAAAAAGRDWVEEYRVLRPDGTERWVSATARPLHDTDGAVTEFLGTCTDVTERREAERSRQAAATEHAARQATEAAARLQAIVASLAAIVWEADAQTWEFSFVSDRAEELLGYPVSQWLGNPDFWPSIIHPDERDEVIALCAKPTAEGRDHDLTYRAVTADGRVLWLHDVVHVVCDDDGTPRRLHGVMIDITEQKRREQAAALLAEAGRLLAMSGTVEDKLTAVAALAVGELGGLATVWLRGDDGRFRAVAAAPPAAAQAVRTLAPTILPDEVEDAYRAGQAFVVPHVGEDLRRTATEDDALYQAAAAVGSHSTLIVPLVADGRVVGSLSLVATVPDHRYDEADLALAGDLGQRIAAMVAAERLATRQRQLQQLTAALASADTLTGAATALATGVAATLGAAGVAVFAAQPEDPLLHLVHTLGYPPDVAAAFTTIHIDAPLPAAEAARTAQPVWLPDQRAWRDRYPQLAVPPADALTHAVATLPLLVGDRVVGVLAARFPTAREFAPDERCFALTLVGQTAQAFQRAADADQRRSIAETLQHSLLPPALPELDRVTLAARYLPGVAGVEAGGDWYDVLTLDDHRVAVVVGDVVGQGSAAAAVMGQLRSALAAYLLDGHSPAAALARLDRFAHRVEGALASTAVCLVLNTRTGQVRWARAGHPPPLVLDDEGARYLDGAQGCVLGLTEALPFTESHATLTPGSSVLLYTDGLVERRGENVDDGLARLAAAAAPHSGATPAGMTAAVLDRVLDGAGPADDVALLVARLRPGPLHQRLPAVPAQLPAVRRAVRDWAMAAALPDVLADDLQLALGEAVANAVEHAYAGRTSGELTYHLDQTGDGAVQVEVRDYGSWRPVPAEPGYRGRGLAMIHKLGRDVTVDIGGPGTHLRFILTTPPADAEPQPAGRAARPGPVAPAEPAELRVHRDPGSALRLQLCGDLDLATIGPLRAALLDHLHATDDAITLDTREVTYLSSAGVGLLIEAARAAPGRLHLQVRPDSPTARVLTLTGLDQHLPLTR